MRLTKIIDGGVQVGAVKHLAKGAIHNALLKLAEYEDAEEQKRLFITPVPVKSKVFVVRSLDFGGQPYVVTKELHSSDVHYISLIYKEGRAFANATDATVRCEELRTIKNQELFAKPLKK